MSDRQSWEARYRTGDHAEPVPDPFLVQARDQLEELLPRRRKALDLAGGAGRNSIYLAQLGFDVTLVDFSSAALQKARRLAAKQGLSLNPIQADLTKDPHPWLLPSSLDLVIVFFYLERSLFPAIHDALKPGGLLVYRTYTLDQLRFPGRPRHPMHLLQQNELLNAFRDFRVLFYEEVVKGKGVAGLIAQRPD